MGLARSNFIFNLQPVESNALVTQSYPYCTECGFFYLILRLKLQMNLASLYEWILQITVDNLDVNSKLINGSNVVIVDVHFIKFKANNVIPLQRDHTHGK